MIRINLLSERKAAGKSSFSFHGGQTVTVACSVVLVGTFGVIGWRFWTIGRDSARLDLQMSSAQQETQRLRSVIQHVEQFEQRRAQLQQRVALVEELRRNQRGPVHMLDQISRALPDTLWLTGLRQGVDPNEVLIEGRSTSLTGLSDFVANLEATGFFKRSVEIVSTQVESIEAPPGELSRFQVRAMFQQPGAAEAPAASPAPAGAAPASAAGGVWRRRRTGVRRGRRPRYHRTAQWN
jgi:type IV pilus assembly protein PilN